MISPHDCDPNFLFQLQQAEMPLSRNDLQNQPVVLTREELDTLGYIDIVLANGEEVRVEAASLNDEILILFPDELGN